MIGLLAVCIAWVVLVTGLTLHTLDRTEEKEARRERLEAERDANEWPAPRKIPPMPAASTKASPPPMQPFKPVEPIAMPRTHPVPLPRPKQE